MKRVIKFGTLVEWTSSGEGLDFSKHKPIREQEIWNGVEFNPQTYTTKSVNEYCGKTIIIIKEH